MVRNLNQATQYCGGKGEEETMGNTTKTKRQEHGEQLLTTSPVAVSFWWHGDWHSVVTLSAGGGGDTPAPTTTIQPVGGWGQSLCGLGRLKGLWKMRGSEGMRGVQD